jgi:hypothetical protein
MKGGGGGGAAAADNNNKKNQKKNKTKGITGKAAKNKDHIHHSMATPEMSWLKQGGFQLLPSRDRSGRRVVIFHGLSLEEQQSKLNNNNIHSMVSSII